MNKCSGIPVTPDFIKHEWIPLESVILRERFVELHWKDGLVYQAFSLWLLENAPSIGIDPIIRESTVEPSELPQASVLRDASVDSDGALLLDWSGHDLIRVHPGWLRYVAEGKLTVSSGLPVLQRWDSSAIDAPISLDAEHILERNDLQREWLEGLVRFGLVRLKGTPAEAGFLEELMGSVGPIRASNFGAIFTVQSAPVPDSTANTGLRLGQHTDLPTRETPPGYQFLHCLDNDVAGGNSRMTDGLAVVQALQDEQPEAFELLTTERWLFMNRTPDAEHRWEGSIIELPSQGRPLTLRAFYPVRSAPLMSPEKIPAAYEALATFSSYAHDPRYQISFPILKGDLIGFDNRRVMHGRDAFDVSGPRHLVGCYIDHDEVYSRLRVLNRPQN